MLQVTMSILVDLVAKIASKEDPRIQSCRRHALKTVLKLQASSLICLKVIQPTESNAKRHRAALSKALRIEFKNDGAIVQHA